MSNSKMFVFGSFTEDETKSLLLGPKSAEKPVKKTETQLGRVNATGVNPLNDQNSQSSVHLPSRKGTAGSRPPSVHLKKNAEPPSVKRENGSVTVVPGAGKENGNLHGPNPVSSLSNGVKVLEIENKSSASSNVLQNEDTASNYSQGSMFDVLDAERSGEGDQEGFIVDSSVAVSEEKFKSNGPISPAKSLLPRGIINSGNLCFLNATLQALLSCSPFVQLLQELRHRSIPKAGCPTLNAFAELISDFEKPGTPRIDRKDPTAIDIGRPLSPAMFEVVLHKFTPDVRNSISGRPRQEDAQEFLSFVMDQMHDELLKLGGQSSVNNHGRSSLLSSDEDEWETVGRKNKSAVTRTQSFVPSELTDIFGGHLKSVVKSKGNKASATVQPFLLLHLDIHPDSVHTIEEALHLFSAPETLEGYKTSASGKADVVAASKSVKIQTLPKILILHLMRFGYGSQGSTKLHKPVHFPLELMLGRELLASLSSEAGRKYELVATVTHHGREPSRGHYTADTRHCNGQWLRYDDASVTTINTSKVLHDQAYVLFYKQHSTGRPPSIHG